MFQICPGEKIVCPLFSSYFSLCDLLYTWPLSIHPFLISLCPTCAIRMTHGRNATNSVTCNV